MKFALILVVLGVASLASSSASAASWVFERSYYTHDPVNQVRVGPQVTGGPYYSRVQGEFVRTGYRYLRSQINVRGLVFDQYNSWDSWIQSGSQF
ncbi:MAG: hypothetical protein SGJ20_22450 [Planctomycetota bacterium]|nr:hypothetical protein [Planctomycetota bacterium]